MSSTDTSAQASGAAAGEVAVEKSPEEFASILKQNFRIKNENDTANQLVDNAMSTFLAEALSDQALIKEDVYDTIDEMIAKLDEKLTAQVNEIIHAEEFQTLESAWRGIDYLVHQSETDASLKLQFLNISKKELAGVFKSYRGAKWDQSPLFKQIYEAEFGQLGGQPYGCLVGDYEFSYDPQDITVLRGMAKIASAAHAPFLAAANPQLMQMDSWTELPAKRDLSKIFDTEIHAQWRTLRESEDPLPWSDNAPRAGSPALRCEVRPGGRIRLRRRVRRRQPRELRLDELGLCHGNQRQPCLQGIRLDCAHPRRRKRWSGGKPADPRL